jgi:hypothetical protein
LTAAVKRAAGELQTRGLWGVVDRGFQIHDYLEYQDSKELVESRKASARDRMKDRRAGPRRAVDSTPFVRTNILGTSLEPSLYIQFLFQVLKRKRIAALENGSATLLQDRYPEWYAQFRHGARLKLTANSLAYADAMKICETWDDARD